MTSQSWCCGRLPHENSNAIARYFLAPVTFPPLRPAALCCAVVPPCEASPLIPLFLPPLCEAFGEFAIRAARSFDIPLSRGASYWSALAGPMAIGPHCGYFGAFAVDTAERDGGCSWHHSTCA